MGEGQLLLIEQITQFSGFMDLIHLYLKEGASPFYIDGGQLKAQPALSTFYLACANSISRNIERLGLNKAMVRRIPGLHEYIEVNSNKKRLHTRIFPRSSRLSLNLFKATYPSSI